MQLFKKTFLLSLVLSLSLFTFYCCGGGDDDDDSNDSDDTSISDSNDTDDTVLTYNFVGTQTAGDFWQLEQVFDDSTLEEGTIELENSTLGYTYSGDFEGPIDPGFVEINITQADDPYFEESTTGYMVSVPGTMDIIALGPFQVFDHGDDEDELPVYGTSNPPIVAVNQGDCLSEDGIYYMIMMPYEDWDSTEDMAYGTAAFSFDADNNTYDITLSTYLLDGTTLISDALIDDATCEDGVITGTLTVDTDSIDVKISFTETGLCFIDLPSGQGALVGVKSDDAIDTSDFLEDGRTLTGMYFNSQYGYSDGTSAPETDPTYAVTDGEKLIGYQYTQSLDEDHKSDPLEISLEDMTQPYDGLIRAKFTDDEESHDFVMAIRQIDDKYFMFAISDNWPSYHGYNILLIEQ